MAQQYVEQRDGGYWVAGTRVSLDSVVYAFLDGLSPESIVDSFEILTLEQVYGAIAYYLGHRLDLDAYLKASEAEFDEFAAKRVRRILCCTKSCTRYAERGQERAHVKVRYQADADRTDDLSAQYAAMSLASTFSLLLRRGQAED